MPLSKCDLCGKAAFVMPGSSTIGARCVSCRVKTAPAPETSGGPVDPALAAPSECDELLDAFELALAREDRPEVRSRLAVRLATLLDLVTSGDQEPGTRSA